MKILIKIPFAIRVFFSAYRLHRPKHWCVGTEVFKTAWGFAKLSLVWT